jgi:N-acetyl-anhydromuramyl-L-alanine amidase AmpD
VSAFSEALAAAVPLDTAHMVPGAPGQAIGGPWPSGKPECVTLHWGVTRSKSVMRATIAGPMAERKGVASAHIGVYDDAVDLWIDPDDPRWCLSWHAGKNQRVDPLTGGALTHPHRKGTRCAIGIETATMGIVTTRRSTGEYILTCSPRGEPIMVEAWPESQLALLARVGRAIVARWPHIGPERWHGHHDICPVDAEGRTYKTDVCGFPFARFLREVYPDREIVDHWTPTLTAVQRQRALIALGVLVKGQADGVFGIRSRAALAKFQASQGLAATGCWGTFASRAAHRVLAAKGIDLAAVTAGGHPLTS